MNQNDEADMENWKTLSKEIVFAAAPYLEVSKQTVQLPDGKQVDDFYQVHFRSFVIVVPVLENGKILTITQYKHGPGRVSVTFPAGFVEDGEDPLAACERELMEETGYKAAKVTHLGEFVDNGNQRGCLGNYYVAHGCRRLADAESGDLEEMLIKEMAPEQIDSCLTNGEISIVHNACVWSMARSRNLI